MKKHLIATAVVAAFAAPAMAQNATMYGILDVGYNSAKLVGTYSAGAADAEVKKSSINAGNMSSSRLGVTGSEDLGGGMAAIYTAEFGLKITDPSFSGSSNDVNSATFDNRQTFAGLKGAFGQVTVGRQLSLTHGVIAGSEAGGANNVIGSTTYTGGNSTTDFRETPFYGNSAYLIRANNAMVYTSPNLNGVTISGLVSRTKVASEDIANIDADTRVQGLAVRYTSGPLAIAGSMTTIKVTATLTTAASFGLMGRTPAGNNEVDIKQSETALGASYDLGAAKIFANYLITKATGADDGVDFDEKKRTATNIGITAPFGASSVFASYGTGKTTLVDADGLAGVANDKEKFRGYQLGYVYNLSKRSNLYAVYGNVRADDGADTLKATMYAVGARHSF